MEQTHQQNHKINGPQSQSQGTHNETTENNPHTRSQIPRKGKKPTIILSKTVMAQKQFQALLLQNTKVQRQARIPHMVQEQVLELLPLHWRKMRRSLVHTPPLGV